MGVCASKRRLVVVRQSSALKLPLAPSLSLKQRNGAVGRLTRGETGSTRQLEKQDSDLNLLPTEAQKNWNILSDESVFEREKRMVVLLVGCSNSGSAGAEKAASQLALLDVDFQSPGFGKVIARQSLPLGGEELFSFACMRNSHSGLHQEELDHLVEQQRNQEFTLVAPVPSHSRIYVLNLVDGTMHEGSGSLGKRMMAPPVADGALLTRFRLQKCITREELSRWDLGAPLTVCSNSAGRSSAVPLVVVTAIDRTGHCKGDLLRLDRRTFCPVDRRKRSITEEDRQSSNNSGYSTFSGSPQHSIRNGPGISTMATGQQSTKFPNFGGALAISLRNGVMITTEWGHLERILQEKPKLKQDLGSQEILNDDGPKTVYGCTLNVWEMRRRKLLQTIRLDPEEGLWPVCVRMLHHPELSHGFVCSALGSCLFHVHKCTKTGLFKADRVIKFSSVSVGSPSDWAGACPEVPAFLTDMAISMDDQYLYVCAAFHGFVAQMNISDPFRPSMTQKIFLGGVLYRCLGVAGLGKMPKNSGVTMSYNTEQVKLSGRFFEGGPSRLQLSLDGRRLFITNSFLSNWDQHFFPQLTDVGSTIALVHVDPTGNRPMQIDKDFGIHFDSAEGSGTGLANGNGTAGGRANGGPPNHNSHQQHPPTSAKAMFYAREMRFLGGDCTADFI